MAKESRRCRDAAPPVAPTAVVAHGSSNRRRFLMSTAQRISVGFGIFYLAIGVLGFIPGITAASTQPGQGLLLGVFAVNMLHNIVHLAVGAVLVWAGMSAS